MSALSPLLETIPHRSPLYKALPRYYADFEKISVICRAEPSALKRLLPPPMEYVSDLIEVFVYRCPKVLDVSYAESPARSYIESGIAVQARVDGVLGGHVAYEYVTTDDAMAPGREIWGYPKKLADVTWVERDGKILSQTTRQGQLLIDLTFEPGSDFIERPILQPRLQVKKIPSADGQGYDVHQVVLNRLNHWIVHDTTAGTATVNLGGTESMDPLFDLGPLEILGAEKIIAEFELGYGEVLKDLNHK